MIWDRTIAGPEPGGQISERLNQPRARPPVIDGPGMEPPLSLITTDGETRGLDCGVQGHLRTFLLQGQTV